MTTADKLLRELAEANISLHQDRDDMVVGITASLLDLYRISIENGHQTKEEAVARLTAQKRWLEKEISGQVGAKFLSFLIGTLANDKLDAASWMRTPPAGSA